MVKVMAVEKVKKANHSWLTYKLKPLIEGLFLL